MLVDARPRKRNAPRPAEKSALGFLQWIRGRQCMAFGYGGCGGKIQAAHVDYAGDKGLSTKVADKHAIPLCAAHHALQHQKGWAWFEANVLGQDGIALKAAAFLWARWPGRPGWEKRLQK